MKLISGILRKIRRLILPVKAKEPPVVEEKFRISKSAEFVNSTIGNYSYISPGAKIHSATIGKFSSIGPNAIVGYGEHPVNFLSTSPLFYYSGKKFDIQFTDIDHFDHHQEVLIGNDVWVGANVYIKNGVKIGDGAVVAAGAIVIKDVPPYAIVGGVPAKILKYRFEEHIIADLLKIKWWDLPIEKLKEKHMLFVTNDFYNSLDILNR